MQRNRYWHTTAAVLIKRGVVVFLRMTGVLVGVSVLIFGSAYMGWALRDAAPPLSEPERLPSIVEIQQKVGATPDGKLGPETQQLWERAFCNQESARSWPQ